MKDIYHILEELKISYEKYDHPAVFTVEESMRYDRKIDAAHSKNLFLRNKKGTLYYLVIMEAEKRLDIKKLETLLNEKRLSFGSPEKMMEYLGLSPGSVSPFGLINDTSKNVKVVVDQDLMQHKNQGYHPNMNIATLAITTEDFKKFLEWTGNTIIYMPL